MSGNYVNVSSGYNHYVRVSKSNVGNPERVDFNADVSNILF